MLALIRSTLLRGICPLYSRTLKKQGCKEHVYHLTTPNARHQRRREAPSAACRCYAAPDSSDEPLPHEHDLARHASLPEQLVRLSCLGKRKSLRDEWLSERGLMTKVTEGFRRLPIT